MKRPKTMYELKQDILASPVLRKRSQEEIGISLNLNQATVSRILRGQFKRRSSAVERICRYAQISRITTRPLPELDASLDQLTRIARRGAPGDRQALKLIRLAAEMLAHGTPAASTSRRPSVR